MIIGLDIPEPRHAVAPGADASPYRSRVAVDQEEIRALAAIVAEERRRAEISRRA